MSALSSSPSQPLHVCSQCGLSYGRGGVTTSRGEATLHFCCYGCSFTHSVLGEQGEAASANLFLIRLGIAAFLAMNVMALSWAIYDKQWIALGMDEDALPFLAKLLFVFSLPIMIIAGYPFVRNAIAEVRSLRLSMDSLIALGTIAAFGFSSVQAFTGGDRLYFDTATMTLVLVTAGRYLEATAKVRASIAIRQLLQLQPDVARVLKDGKEEIVPTSQVPPGSEIKVLPGERVPLDGVITHGTTSVDDAFLTGESLPKPKKVGDELFAATVNIDGVVTLRVSAAQEESLHSRIVRLMEQAQQSRSPIQQTVDRISGLFIPIVIGIAALTFAAWWQIAGVEEALLHGLTVLVVACPCALGIGAPVATATAIGFAAECGVLIRSSETLEKLADTKVVAFDKTGTLTNAELAVNAFSSTTNGEEALSIAASLEQNSEHPIGQAIVRYARKRGATLREVRNAKAFPGKGIRGDVLINGEWKEVIVGTRELFPSYTSLDDLANESHTVGTRVYIGWNDKIRASAELSDSIRKNAVETIEQLHSRKIETALLSGDSEKVTKQLADVVGIANAYGRLFPHDKFRILQSLKSRGVTVMVGDGINDAPSLAAADVGITLGSATDIAKESADVTIVGNHLDRIPWLISYSKKTLHTIYWNLLWAFGYNAVGIALAVVGILQPVMAAGAMVVSSVFIIGNSMRLKPGPDELKGMLRGEERQHNDGRLRDKSGEGTDW